MARTADSPALLMFRLAWSDRKLVLLTLLALAAIYVFGLREPLAVSLCHTGAQDVARNLMRQRAAANPGNAQLQEAARGNLYANEDYAPVYRNCLLERGYAS